LDNLTVVIPFWHGHATLPALLDTVPADIPTLVINDYGSAPPDVSRWPNVRVIKQHERGYFSGGCNRGFAECDTDVLVLNQDGELLNGWQRALAERQSYAIIGDGVMKHPGWPNGYVQGTFMFVRRDLLNAIGGFNGDLYPLWGATCEYQLRACRSGFRVQPLDVRGYFKHKRPKTYGTSIRQAIEDVGGDRAARRWLIKTPPEISVIITCYNYGRYLEQAVTSVLDQTFQATEIIIVDDGSMDNTPIVGQRLHDPWKAIHYVRQRNGGASSAANAGLSIAKGRFCTVLDGDDWMAPRRLERMYELQLANPHSVVYDDIVYHGRNGARQRKVMPEYVFDELLDRNCMHKGIMFPRIAWLETGGYSNRMDNGREDWEFNINLGLHGYCGVHLREAHYCYRREGQGRTQRVPRPRSYFLHKVARIHSAVYSKGELPMACCGGRRKTTPRVVVSKTGTRSSPAVAALAASRDDGSVLVKYLGANIGNQTINGPTGQRYKYGRNQRNMMFWADPVDAEWLTGMVEFERAALPAVQPQPEESVVKSPEPTPSEEPQKEKVVAPAPTPVEPVEYNVSPAAASFAEVSGVDLAEVTGTGRDGKIIKRDVQAVVKARG